MKASLRKLSACSKLIGLVVLIALSLSAQPFRSGESNPPAAGQLQPVTPTVRNPVAVDPRTYRVGAEDVLALRIWREPELSGPKVVRPDGKISMPMVGEIQAMGLTPEQIQEDIVKRLGEFIKDPQVSVELQEVRSRKYFLLGAIDRPGEYRFALNITVLEALSNGGRFQDFARTSKIVVLRGDKKLPFNYKDVSRGRKMQQNIAIEDGDKIIIPE